MFGIIALGIDYLVFLEMLYVEVVDDKTTLVSIEHRPYIGHVIVYDFFESSFNHYITVALVKVMSVIIGNGNLLERCCLIT